MALSSEEDGVMFFPPLSNTTAFSSPHTILSLSLLVAQICCPTISTSPSLSKTKEWFLLIFFSVWKLSYLFFFNVLKRDHFLLKIAAESIKWERESSEEREFVWGSRWIWGMKFPQTFFVRRKGRQKTVYLVRHAKAEHIRLGGGGGGAKLLLSL